MPRSQSITGVTLDSDESLREMEPAPSEVRVRNRRRHYLSAHPEYLKNPELELAGLVYPLLWDRLVRKWQSPAEREADGRRKGFSGILEADILRGEAKTEALRHPDSDPLFTYKRAPNGEILAEEKNDAPTTKAEGLERWMAAMKTRFIRGHDDDFDYTEVDKNETYDDHSIEEHEAAEKYFDAEQPQFLQKTNDGEEQGETGIQDF